MNHLEIKHLKLIRTLSETGNMTRAAEKLFITQSALSQQLKDIESKLKVDLFFRTPKKMILTPTGKKLLKTATHVIERLEEAELEIAKIVSGDTGELKVGTQCIFCYKWLPSVMEMFQRKFPNIEFTIGTSTNMIKELESGSFDLVITGTFLNNDSIIHTPLFEDIMVCIMNKDHPLSTKSYLDFNDFRKTTLITHTEKKKYQFYQSTLKLMGIEPRRFMTVGQPQAIIEMVASGFGVSVFPRWAVSNALETTDIKALPITRKGIPLTWNAAFPKKSSTSVFHNEFIKIIRRINLTGNAQNAFKLVSGT